MLLPMPTGKSVQMEKTGKGKMSLETVLADEDWDYVSLQQASPFRECMRRMKLLFPSS